jgi:hypothetical protein
VPPGGIKYYFVRSLEALSYHFSLGTARAGMRFVTNQPFFFSSYFLSRSPTNYRLVLVIVDILVLVFILLISDSLSFFL